MSTKPKTTQKTERNHSDVMNGKDYNSPLVDDTITDTGNGGPRPEGQTQPSREDDEEEVKRTLNQISKFQEDNPGKNVPLILNIKKAFFIFK